MDVVSSPLSLLPMRCSVAHVQCLGMLRITHTKYAIVAVLLVVVHTEGKGLLLLMLIPLQ